MTTIGGPSVPAPGHPAKHNPTRVGLAVLHAKGGVGRPTTVWQLGSDLALRGKRVRIEDLDQGRHDAAACCPTASCPALEFAKGRVAEQLGSVALRADAAETMLCSYLSAVVLLGLAANALFAWCWMDPVAGLVVAGLAIREGREAWTSGELCEC